MATLEQRLQDLATRAGARSKELLTLINGNVADLAALTTTAKDNLVNAINEVRALANGKADPLGFTPVDSADVGAANGVASLDGTGTVPASQLPSFVDDVLEFANQAAFPATGESGKIYIALDTSQQFRWTGSTYAAIVASPGTTDAITEGAVNLFFTDARAQAALAPLLGDTDRDLVADFDAALI